jgi:hypothetical protein
VGKLYKRYYVDFDIEKRVEYLYGINTEKEDYDDLDLVIIGTYKKESDMVEYLTSLIHEFEVFDARYPGFAYFNACKCRRVTSEFGIHDREMQKCYMGKGENDYEPDCRSCGDGGCIHCRPSWFI